jgi:hypothetical protein
MSFRPLNSYSRFDSWFWIGELPRMSGTHARRIRHALPESFGSGVVSNGSEMDPDVIVTLTVVQALCRLNPFHHASVKQKDGPDGAMAYPFSSLPRIDEPLSEIGPGHEARYCHHTLQHIFIQQTIPAFYLDTSLQIPSERTAALCRCKRGRWYDAQSHDSLSKSKDHADIVRNNWDKDPI